MGADTRKMNLQLLDDSVNIATLFNLRSYRVRKTTRTEYVYFPTTPGLSTATASVKLPVHLSLHIGNPENFERVIIYSNQHYFFVIR